jgi:hypothetical protein
VVASARLLGAVYHERAMLQDYLPLIRLSAAVLPLLGLAACGGGSSGDPDPDPPSGPTVIVSGKITFDRIPFKATHETGLDAGAPVELPARQVVVEAIDPGNNNNVLASTSTDTAGDYSLTVPAGRSMFIRARARMLKTGTAPTWDFSVRNNTNGDAMYVLDGSTFDSGSANSTRNLRASSGWDGTTYAATRAAAPFAILDTVFRSKELVLTAAASAQFPALQLFWSASNRPSESFCPDQGNIGSTSYIVFEAGERDTCSTPQAGVSGIYVQGDFTIGDTDEFDPHVIAHEFGHYFEHRFSRSDSMGGQHAISDRLDLRLAFSEGWGHAFGAMSLNDSRFRDSFNGMNRDTTFDLESATVSSRGWFSELSVGKMLWDFFDGGVEAGDTVELGFAPIHAVMVGAQRSTTATTSIFPFATELRRANSASASAIRLILSDNEIDGTDAFGSNESNHGNGAIELPIHRALMFNTSTQVCSFSLAGSTDLNKLGNRVLFRLDNDTTRNVVIQAVGNQPTGQTVAATDPDILVFRAGELLQAGRSEVPNRETIPAFSLPAGTFIIEVFDFELVTGAPRCMLVSIQG